MRFAYVLFFLFAVSAKAQLTNAYGTVPPGVKWQQINTDKVNVIFPEGLQHKANRIANIIDYLAESKTATIGDKFEKVNIFVVNNTAVSNGYVTPVPFHSKFYTMMPQFPFAGTLDWIDLLSIHEYRHVMQMNNFSVGITGIVKKTFGELFWSAFMNMAIPNWFWEGDAVFFETALTNSGRGRLPLFSARFDGIMNLDKPFGYEKMRCGSYKDFVPNHYVLGYKMVEYGRQNFGNDIWKKTASDAVKYKGVFFPFSQALKRHTGYGTKEMYNKITESEKDSTINEHESGGVYSSKIEKGNPTFYSNPQFISENKLVAAKYSFEEAEHIVLIDLKSGKERKIMPTGFGFENFDCNDKTVVWNEINKNPRWNYQSKSNVYKYSFESDRKSQLTNTDSYFSPSISPDNHRVAAMGTDDKMNYRIDIIDLGSGDVETSLSNPENYFFRNIDWLDSDNLIAIATKDNKNAIVKINISSQMTVVVFPFSNITFYQLSVNKDKVFFASKGKGSTSSLYYYDLSSGKLFVSKKVSNYLIDPFLSPSGKFIAYCEITFNNTELKVDEFEEFFKPASSGAVHSMDISDKSLFIASSEQGNIFKDIPNDSYDVKDYHTWIHLLNFHSWYPYYHEPDYSLTFLSNDYLNNLSLSVTPEYNSNTKNFTLGTNFNYGRFYPVINLSTKYRFVNSEKIHDETLRGVFTASSSIGLPLSFSRYNYYNSLYLNLDYANTTFFLNKNGKNYTENAGALDFYISHFIRNKGAYRLIYPKLGIWSKLKVYNINTDNFFNSIRGRLLLYFPGLMRTHSTRLMFSGFHLVDDEYYYTSGIEDYDFSRGYYYIKDLKNVFGFKFNYSFPLFYPDRGIGAFTFFKRVRANVYFDIDRNIAVDKEAFYRKSIGLEFLFDNVYFRTFTIPMGIGIDWLLDVEKDKSPLNFRFILEL